MGMTPSAHKRHQLERIRREREALGEIDRRPAKPSWWSDPPRRLPTLGELNRSAPHWLWLHCTDYICTHSGALPLAPLIIRWGEDAPISWLQSQPRCRAYAHEGCSNHPSKCR